MMIIHLLPTILMVVLHLIVSSDAFQLSTQRSIDRKTILFAKGRRSLRKTLKSRSTSEINPMGGEMKSSRNTNWVPVKGIKSMDDLPKEENVVKVIDTMANELTDGATNPTGAVAVANYGAKTFCFSVSCPSCKIPLLKSKIYEPNEETKNVDPRITCGFCKTTYNIRSGERLAESAESTGLLGNVVKGLFSAQDSVPLETYDLGEKDGRVLINLPK